MPPSARCRRSSASPWTAIPGRKRGMPSTARLSASLPFRLLRRRSPMSAASEPSPRCSRRFSRSRVRSSRAPPPSASPSRSSPALARSPSRMRSTNKAARSRAHRHQRARRLLESQLRHRVRHRRVRGRRYLDESPAYKAVGALGIKLGLEWGGNWKTIQDEPHFQLRPAWAREMSERDMLAELRAPARRKCCDP